MKRTHNQFLGLKKTTKKETCNSQHTSHYVMASHAKTLLGGVLGGGFITTSIFSITGTGLVGIIHLTRVLMLL